MDPARTRVSLFGCDPLYGEPGNFSRLLETSFDLSLCEPVDATHSAPRNPLGCVFIRITSHVDLVCAIRKESSPWSVRLHGADRCAVVINGDSSTEAICSIPAHRIIHSTSFAEQALRFRQYLSRTDVWNLSFRMILITGEKQDLKLEKRLQEAAVELLVWIGLDEFKRFSECGLIEPTRDRVLLLIQKDDGNTPLRGFAEFDGPLRQYKEVFLRFLDANNTHCLITRLDSHDKVREVPGRAQQLHFPEMAKRCIFDDSDSEAIVKVLGLRSRSTPLFGGLFFAAPTHPRELLAAPECSDGILWRSGLQRTHIAASSCSGAYYNWTLDRLIIFHIRPNSINISLKFPWERSPAGRQSVMVKVVSLLQTPELSDKFTVGLWEEGIQFELQLARGLSFCNARIESEKLVLNLLLSPELLPSFYSLILSVKPWSRQASKSFFSTLLQPPSSNTTDGIRLALKIFSAGEDASLLAVLDYLAGQKLVPECADVISLWNKRASDSAAQREDRMTSK